MRTMEHLNVIKVIVFDFYCGCYWQQTADIVRVQRSCTVRYSSILTVMHCLLFFFPLYATTVAFEMKQSQCNGSAALI